MNRINEGWVILYVVPLHSCLIHCTHQIQFFYQFKATEVRELLEGNEEKFKGGAGGYVDTSAADKAANASALAAALGTPGFGTPKVTDIISQLWKSSRVLIIKIRFLPRQSQSRPPPTCPPFPTPPTWTPCRR